MLPARRLACVRSVHVWTADSHLETADSHVDCGGSPVDGGSRAYLGWARARRVRRSGGRLAGLRRNQEIRVHSPRLTVKTPSESGSIPPCRIGANAYDPAIPSIT